MKKRIIAIALLFMIFLLIPEVSATESSEIYPVYYPTEDYWYETNETMAEFKGDFKVKSMLLMEASTGKVLYSNNEHESLPIASVTKIMSTLLVMEAIDSGKVKYTDNVTVSERAASMGGSQVFLEPNETMSVEDLLKALVVSSANDATLALAEHICGSEASFVIKMNEKAKELGMSDTTFINTNGLDADGHVSSAYDVALMTRELMTHKDIFNYTTIWMDTIRNGAFGLANTNKLIRFYQGATGMKTGYTSTAKFCLSATAKRDNMDLIAVVLGGETSDDRFSCAKQLLDYGFANYTVTTPEKIKIEPIKVLYGKKNTARLSYNDSSLLIEKGNSAVETKFEVKENVSAPVQNGDIVGVVRYYINGTEIGNTPITICEDVEQMDFITMFLKIWQSITNVF